MIGYGQRLSSARQGGGEVARKWVLASIGPRAYGTILLILSSLPTPLVAQSLQLTVRDAVTLHPVPNVDVTIRGGTPRGGTTDPSGAIAFDFNPGDTLQISLIAFGYLPQQLILTPDATQSFEANVILEPEGIIIPGVTAEAEVATDAPRTLALLGFEHRRKRGFGRFVGPEDLEKIVATDLGDLIRRIPGIRILGNDEPVFIRAEQFRIDGPCYPAIILDGLMVREAGGPGIRFNELVSHRDVLAIEAYASTAGLPTQYGGTGAACGVLLFWTK